EDGSTRGKRPQEEGEARRAGGVLRIPGGGVEIVILIGDYHAWRRHSVQPRGTCPRDLAIRQTDPDSTQSACPTVERFDGEAEPTRHEDGLRSRRGGQPTDEEDDEQRDARFPAHGSCGT